MKTPEPPRSNELRTTPRVAATRCPYCHDDVQPEGSVACQDCLGRHHPSCWDEIGACATCGGARQMRAAPRVLDDVAVRRILLANNYTGHEVDAYLRGEKPVSCHYKGCDEPGERKDFWVAKKKVCVAHQRSQFGLFAAITLAVMGVLLVVLLAT